MGPIFFEVSKQFPDLDQSRMIHESVRRLIGVMVTDLIKETEKRLNEFKPKSTEELRNLDNPVAGFSDEMLNADSYIKKFLFENMYRHYKLNRMTIKGRRVVKDLFQLLLREPECLPSKWRGETIGKPKQAVAQIIADYIGGMTDRSALDDHRHLFDLQSTIS